ncbi:putative plant self-incompatibility S1 [Rosa chinensis]|uniref:S-protein homolog n=1 Tax=Rosa chinensis TaxID=74649 RepID=A0A2P6QKI6_ROSCH|nr:putative plant self-incompatibility S1 [Rosa chinensis]
MSLFARNDILSILLTLFLTICDAATNAKMHVNITSDLSGGAPIDLNIHCKTQKHDFGGLVIPYGSYFDFVFSLSILRRNTILECDAECDGVVHNLVAYNQRSSIIDIVCKYGICLWKIRRDGYCYFNNVRREYDCTPWHGRI